MTRQIEIIGHRGARGLFPENTIEGFERAFVPGVRAFELDVGMTADGVVVVSHDLTLNPAITRDAEGRFLSEPTPAIHDLTFDALRTYDVGRIRPASRYRLPHRAQRAIDGARVPTLDAVLRAIPEASIIVELKTDPRYPTRTAAPADLADAVLAIIDAAGATGRVFLESFDWRGPRHIHRTRPDLRLAWLTRAETVRDAALWLGAAAVPSVPAAVAAEGGGVWAPEYDTLTRASLAEAHALGLRVIPWTVNRRAAMRRLMRWGVDGLITDRPDKLLELVAPS